MLSKNKVQPKKIIIKFFHNDPRYHPTKRHYLGRGAANLLSAGALDPNFRRLQVEYQIHTFIKSYPKCQQALFHVCCLFLTRNIISFHNDSVATASDERNWRGRHNLELLGKRRKEEPLTKCLLIQVNTLRLKDELRGFFRALGKEY